MGLHTGEADLRAGDYYGPAVNRAARVSAAGHGGQILVSHATEELVRDDLPEGAGLVDLGEQRLRDLARPERVFQVTHSGLASEFAPVRSLDAFPTNLPAQRTSFVGREREVADVAAALRTARLVTLTGVGGVGKTRLALEVAAEVLPHRADGVWLCELAPVSESDAVLDAVASAVGVTTSAASLGPAQPERDVLIRHLANRDVLLVLDNCEQVLGAVAELVDDLLDRCPGVRVLATSREGLGVAGEQMVAVGTLTVPKADTAPDVAHAGDAAQLFADRARAAKRDFVLDDDNVGAVVEVCRRLDGIPLAIELAAARTQMLTPAQIAQRLDERFRLLTGSVRGSASRHQTLRAAIDWSYDQLDDRERSVLARLAVFAGSFDLVAAEAVAADGDVDALGAFDVLGQLVGKSLVVATETSEAMAFRLLETIRQYAEERLEDGGAVAATRTRHARHYLALLEHAAATAGEELVHGVGDSAANVVAAFEWCIASGDADGALRHCVAITRLNGLPGLSWRAAADMFNATLAMPGAMEHPHAPTVLASWANFAVLVGGDPMEAYARIQRSLALADELHIGPSALHLQNVATVAMHTGHLDEARDFARRGAVTATDDGDDRVAQLAFTVLSATERYSGNLVAAADAGAQAEAAARRLGADEPLAMALLMQGFAFRDVDPDRALPLLEESATVARKASPDSPNLAFALDNAGLIRHRAGDTAGARRDFEEALDIGVRVDNHDHIANTCAKFALALIDTGDAAETRAAAGLLAGAEQLVAPIVLYPGIGADEADLWARLESSLGAETLSDVRARGAAMDVSETVALARALLARVTGEVQSRG